MTGNAIVLRSVRGPLLAWVVLALGCGEERHRNEDFIPAVDSSATALQSALSAWAADAKGVQVATAPTAVMFADSQREAGRRLLGFSIMGPVAGDAPRCFAVRLALASPEEEVRCRYVVIGIDPLWVIRHDDLEMITHWCNPPPTDKKSSTPQRH